ncbi:hypothetical protein NX722_22455 [Endozoicomonas gorgoniicola]|uniref:Uncharacterized protein n=1 Tax=Endozoicomonas gorgoniicola TaxID=1234144 RepID=A0ABT3N126_9GAMM|nr:hypothetical protein [Endozoicomonas gorgoniicola]MCW7555340.1 hypothetical protein [Endozoicomonas gorgoniicola]
MNHCLPGRAGPILILKIWLVGLVLIIAAPCNAHCRLCGKEEPSTGTHYCPGCRASTIESLVQQHERIAEDCGCAGACNCATVSPGFMKLAVIFAGFGLAEALSTYTSHEFSITSFAALGFFFSAVFYKFKGVIYDKDYAYLPIRRRARSAMLQVNNELGQHPEEGDRINVLSDDFIDLVRAARFGWRPSRGFEGLLDDIHNRWLTIWLRNSSNISERNTSLLLIPGPELTDTNGLVNAFAIGDISALEFPLLRSLLSSGELPRLESELNATRDDPIHIELGYLRISLYPVDQGLFDMFETSTGVYRNLTKEDVIKRIGRLSKILNIFFIIISDVWKTR